MEFYKTKGKIEDVLGCYVSDSPLRTNGRFTVNIGRDYRGIAEVVKGASRRG